MEIEYKDYNYKDKSYNIKFNSKDINGVIGNNSKEIIKIINLKENNIKLYIDKKRVKEIYTYKRKISILKENDYLNIQSDTLYNLMKYILKEKEIYPKNIDKKIKDSLRIVGLNTNILERNITTISTSEKKLLQIAISLLSNPDILLLEEPFRYLDLKNTKKLMIILRKIKDQYNKIIILISKDIEKIYQHTDNVIVCNKDIIIEEETKKLFMNVELLKENKIEIPEIIEFTYNTMKYKKVKIDYYRDIRDIIKDIYKHV